MSEKGQGDQPSGHEVRVEPGLGLDASGNEILVEVRSDFIMDSSGETVDANAGGSAPPTGEGTPGGSFGEVAGGPPGATRP